MLKHAFMVYRIVHFAVQIQSTFHVLFTFSNAIACLINSFKTIIYTVPLTRGKINNIIHR